MMKRNYDKTGLTGHCHNSRTFYVLPFLLLLGACQTTQPYKMELAQGNFISADKVFHLKPGMTKAQVATLLGTPLLAEHVQADQWEYKYTPQPGGAPAAPSTLDLYFKGDILTRFDGQLPPGPGQLATVAYRPAGTYRPPRHRHTPLRHTTRHPKHHSRHHVET